MSRRKRKTVLLYCADETRLGLTLFVLTQQARYNVTACSTQRAAVTALEELDIDVVCVMEAMSDRDGAEHLVSLAKRMQPWCNTVLAIAVPGQRETLADGVTLQDMRSLLATLRLFSARKRGPRTPRVSVAAARGMQAAAVSA